jgi:crotonobetainyl-CoA:carnitine CoA-transferase CaiB-like acyl-CoA transferase
MTRPFEGIKVIDMTHVLAGPFCAYQLALLGADVIKVEPPGGGDMLRRIGADRDLGADGMGTGFLAQGSNKRSLTLDLKTEAGQGVLRRLAERADVLIENYRPGALEALGLGCEDLKALNPRLVYCSLTGFGQTGPKGRHTAYDNVVQAASGVMCMTGTAAASPLKVGAPLIDYGTGTTAAFAIASALFQRASTGAGQHIDCAMLDTMLAFMSADVVGYLRSGVAPGPKGNGHDQWAAYSCYETKDGLLMLGVFTPGQSRRLWEALERPDLAALADWDAIEARRDEIAAALEDILATRTAEAWEEFLCERGLPAARVATMPEALAGEQVASGPLLHRFEGLAWAPDGLTVTTAGFRYEHGGPRIDTPPPTLGADTDAILAELDFGADEVARMRRDGVV